jgi:hypothetical protein
MGLAVRVPERSGIVDELPVRKPKDVALSNEDLDLGAGFGKEGSRLERALTCANDGNAAALEYAEIAMVHRMRDESRRKPGKLWRTPGEGNYPSGDDNSLRTEGLAIVKLDAEPVRIR